MLLRPHYPAPAARDNAQPADSCARSDSFRLSKFDQRYAPQVASWVSGPAEAYWLAPRTAPPITPQRIAAWQGPGTFPLMMSDSVRREVLAYGELNLLNSWRREFWLGHLLVDPRWRGLGLGKALTRLLVARALRRLLATRVTLVVFAENVSAVRCYESVGFTVDGFEPHYFAPYRRHAQLLRMSISATGR